MRYLLLFIIIILIILFLFRANVDQENLDEDPELFSTEKFKDKEHIKSAKCPQCGKVANTYEDVKEYFGLRKVGYTTDIQSWCRECRRDKDDIKNNNLTEDNDLDLFNE